MDFIKTDIEVTISEKVDIADLVNLSSSPDDVVMDTTDLINFITENSGMDWNQVCDFVKPLMNRCDIGNGIEFSVPYFENPDIGTVNEWSNFFFEAYDIVEFECITFKFTD